VYSLNSAAQHWTSQSLRSYAPLRLTPFLRLFVVNFIRCGDVRG
jgi:hypothetical protein